MRSRSFLDAIIGGMDQDLKKLKLTVKQKEKAEKLGLNSIADILSYYPFRYDSREIIPFAEWKIKEKVTFEGEVVSAVRSARFGKNRTVSNFDVMSEDRVLHVSIFNRPWAKNLKLNEVITIYGVYNGKNRVTALSYQEKPADEQESVIPVYAAKEGITQKDIRRLVAKALEASAGNTGDIVPERFIRSYRLLHREDALRMVHFPQSLQEAEAGRRTLKYEEFLLYFTAMVLLKRSGLSRSKTPRRIDEAKLSEKISALPYEMTADQLRSLQDILLDMTSERPMYRLLQGDVGCGKTLVACLAMYACCLSGHQAALLAPTEILAVQHLSYVREFLGDTGCRIEALYSGMSQAEQNRVLEAAASGEADILVGTHSLIQDRIRFSDLGLVVADEQHRFGVEQRRALLNKGKDADFLLMSATPIPRTLASTLYGDMDISTIETMPPGRKPVRTVYIRENSFRSVLDEVTDLLGKGRQLYVICAAVEASEEYEARDVGVTAGNLKKLFGEAYPVASLHGRMSSEEKQETMRKFAAGEISVLVSTTVVEVGVNVVNATGMIIYDAERFGMSQIHQLRGRVQRGSEQGVCWLLSGSGDEKAQQRLEILAATSDGFEISYQDLRLRGPGDILGTKQSGVPDFILANPVEDTKIINQARKDAEWAADHPEECRALAAEVERRNTKGSWFD